MTYAQYLRQLLAPLGIYQLNAPFQGGELEALGTIGSIIGTFLPTFVTIPAVGTAVTFLLFSGILLAIGLIYFLSSKVRWKTCLAAAVLFVLCAVFGHNGSFAFWEDELTYEGESVYNYLQVKETEDRTILSTNVLFGVQSVKQKDGGLTGMYYDTALAAPLMAGVTEKEDFSMLILGMGSGTYATECREYFGPGPAIEGVEIDQDITDLARAYFDLPEDVTVTTYDGRAYLQAMDKHYDVIMVDAYQDITIPFQMSTVEFFTLVADHLTEDGVMVVNMNMHSDGEGSINAHLSDTISSVFENVYTADVPRTTNRELFAAVDGGVSEAEAGFVNACADSLSALCDRDGLAGEKAPLDVADFVTPTPQAAPAERTVIHNYYTPYHYEYRSKCTLLGLPLVHIHLGYGLRRARGIIAIGNVATGLVAIGGFSAGLLSIGGLGIGLLTLAGLAAGGLAVGGMAFGLLAALGGAGALMAGSVEKLEVICWEDLGCEAVRRMEVKDFPLTVILDSQGGDLYESGPAAYLDSLAAKEG